MDKENSEQVFVQRKSFGGGRIGLPRCQEPDTARLRPMPTMTTAPC